MVVPDGTVPFTARLWRDRGAGREVRELLVPVYPIGDAENIVYAYGVVPLLQFLEELRPLQTLSGLRVIALASTQGLPDQVCHDGTREPHHKYGCGYHGD